MSFTSRRAVILGSCLVVVIITALVVTVAVQRRRADAVQLAAQRGAASANVHRYQSVDHVVSQLDAVITATYNQYAGHYAAASSAGEQRHEGSIGGTLTATDGLALARKEQHAVDDMTTDVERLADIETRISDQFETLYGPDAVRAYRSGVQDLLTERRLALSRWSRAIGDVVDYFREEVNREYGVSGPSIEQYYQQSDEEMTRSAATMKGVVREEVALSRRLAADKATARRRLEALWRVR